MKKSEPKKVTYYSFMSEQKASLHKPRRMYDENRNVTVTVKPEELGKRMTAVFSPLPGAPKDSNCRSVFSTSDPDEIEIMDRHVKNDANIWRANG